MEEHASEHIDKELVEAAQANTEQFAVLYEKYVERIFQFIYYRTGKNRERAEDMTAEVFARALNHLETFEWQGHPYSSYLYQVARTVCQDYYKEKTIVDVDDVVIADSAHENAKTSADIGFLWGEIRKLPEQTQEYFELRYLEDLSYDDIAEIVGKKPGTVRTAMSRAISNLQQTYEEEH